MLLTRQAENEAGRAATLRVEIDHKKHQLEEFMRSRLQELEARGLMQDSSPDSPSSETSTECLMHLLQQCDPNTASTIKDTINRHKKELIELEEELQSRVASVATHRAKVDRLSKELSLLAAQDLGLRHALASDLTPTADRENESSTPEGVKRSKSEVVLRRTPREEVLDPLSADEREEFKRKKMR
ncbi:hypothetical protein O0L34_g4032 [Tuta absoluta]|nr:hypothetical protein O0L34_g4032 [Tuta absoluta]